MDFAEPAKNTASCLEQFSVWTLKEESTANSNKYSKMIKKELMQKKVARGYFLQQEKTATEQWKLKYSSVKDHCKEKIKNRKK